MKIDFEIDLSIFDTIKLIKAKIKNLVSSSTEITIDNTTITIDNS